MLSLILMLSLFCNPHIENCIEQENILELEVFVKSKKCGSISISQTSINYGISCGFNISKGFIDVNKAILKYENNSLILKSIEYPNKLLLKINCSSEIYFKAYSYLEAVKNCN